MIKMFSVFSFCLLFNSKLIPAVASPKTGKVRRAKSNAAMISIVVSEE
jgi:hypothetical protein